MHINGTPIEGQRPIAGLNTSGPATPGIDRMSQRVFKVVLVGDSGAGKTSIIQRATDSNFDPSESVTMGVDCKVKRFENGEDSHLVTLWDTAGQERFHALTRSLYRGAHGILLVYDVSLYTSFESLHRWEEDMRTMLDSPEVIRMVVANKIDMVRRGAREVSKAEGMAWAHERGMMYTEMSAKSCEGLNVTFDLLLQQLLSVPEDRPLGRSASPLSVDASSTLRPRHPNRCC